MKGKKPNIPSDDLFRSRLDQIINLRHELVVLADEIDWHYLDGKLDPLYTSAGRPAIPHRIMIALHLLKQMYQLSDEEVCDRWVVSPYFQYFCGEEFFQHKFPIDRSSMTRWRQRVGEDFCEQLMQESLRVAYESSALKKHI